MKLVYCTLKILYDFYNLNYIGDDNFYRNIFCLSLDDDEDLHMHIFHRYD